MFHKVNCPSCGVKISVDGALSLKKTVASCPICNARIVKKEMSFPSFLVIMLISFLVMSIGLSSILFYAGISETAAKYVGLIMTFVFVFFLLKRSLRWSVLKDK